MLNVYLVITVMFCTAGRQRFNVAENITIKLVLEDDGFEIEKDFYPSLSTMTQLMLLVGEESWEKPTGLF